MFPLQSAAGKAFSAAIYLYSENRIVIAIAMLTREEILVAGWDPSRSCLGSVLLARPKVYSRDSRVPAGPLTAF